MFWLDSFWKQVIISGSQDMCETNTPVLVSFCAWLGTPVLRDNLPIWVYGSHWGDDVTKLSRSRNGELSLVSLWYSWNYEIPVSFPLMTYPQMLRNIWMRAWLWPHCGLAALCPTARSPFCLCSFLHRAKNRRQPQVVSVVYRFWHTYLALSA